MPKPSSKSPSSRSPAPQDLQTIDPGALAGVSGGARAGRSASASSGGGGGGGGGGGYDSDAVVGALTEVLHSLHSLANQPSHGFGAQEMMLFMMMMQQRSAPVTVVQPALPAVYANGKTRIF